jgi:hypothetical protein
MTRKQCCQAGENQGAMTLNAFAKPTPFCNRRSDRNAGSMVDAGKGA